MTTVGDIHRLITGWAPKEIAWERDNVGLQVGDLAAEVRGVIVRLDCTRKVIGEAKRKKANLIVSHHPLLFRPPKTITQQYATGQLIHELITKNINLYSAHTNLDFTRGGTSFAIAEALGLSDVDFLHKNYRVQRKIVTFVPEDHLASVRNAMAGAGAGIIGNYDHCSFASRGTGSFKGNALANPVTGNRLQLEQLPEVRLEMIADHWDVDDVVRAMKAAHPYEEVAYDVYPLENTSSEFGLGLVGSLKKPMQFSAFLNIVKRQLRVDTVRHTAGNGRTIRRVAACGGAGSELTDVAITKRADAFITADIRYHEFHHAADKIVLIDAGHYETEHPVVNAVVKRLKREFDNLGMRIPIATSQVSTNPIFYT